MGKHGPMQLPHPLRLLGAVRPVAASHADKGDLPNE